jgi:phage gp36-like protein
LKKITILYFRPEKGIVTAVIEAFQTALYFYCCQHIADNLQQRYRNKVRPLFWIAARAKTSSAFTAAIDVIQKENNNAFLYLNDIDRKLWTRVYAPYPK